jgi:hypothetical protein
MRPGKRAIRCELEQPTEVSSGVLGLVALTAEELRVLQVQVRVRFKVPSSTEAPVPAGPNPRDRIH